MSWADLLPDLLRLISGSLHEIGDFVRFHSVCRAWRDAAPASFPQCLPWLLAPGGTNSPSIARFRSIFSKTTWCAPGTYSLRNRWLATEDGTAAWLLTSEAGGPSPSLRLVDPFTGAATDLPPFARHVKGACIPYSNGFVLADGTLVLYAIEDFDKYFCFVKAAVLRPGDTAWMEGGVSMMVYRGFRGSLAVAYHDGEIVLVDLLYVYTVKLRIPSGGGGGNNGDVVDDFATGSGEAAPWRPQAHPRRVYTFKSRGELLVACLFLEKQYGVDPRSLAGAYLLIYALEHACRWVERDARSLGDRVLFLGCPTSFAVDAARFGGAIGGGCAYFVLSSWNAGLSWPRAKECRVYKYSFEDGSATVVEELPTGAPWNDDELMTWLVPQPSVITPGREIRERLVQDPEKQRGVFCPRSIIRASRTVPGPQFRIFVGNLSSWLGCLDLKDIFSQFGEVSDARIICDRRRFNSWGFGFVTMATIYEPVDFFAAMDGQDIFGHILRVKLGEQRPEGPFVMPLLAPKQGSDLNASAAAWKA